MEPPRPEDDDPDPKYTAPLFPEAALPALSTTNPLVPDPPELNVLNRSDPLLVDPDPVTILTRPPVTEEDPPADNTI